MVVGGSATTHSTRLDSGHTVSGTRSAAGRCTSAASSGSARRGRCARPGTSSAAGSLGGPLPRRAPPRAGPVRGSRRTRCKFLGRVAQFAAVQPTPMKCSRSAAQPPAWPGHRLRSGGAKAQDEVAAQAQLGARLVTRRARAVDDGGHGHAPRACGSGVEKISVCTTLSAWARLQVGPGHVGKSASCSGMRWPPA